MEQCSEADMTFDQRDLKYIFTNAMKQTRPGRLYKYIITNAMKQTRPGRLYIYIITNAMKQTRPGRLTENSQVHWDKYLNLV